MHRLSDERKYPSYRKQVRMFVQMCIHLRVDSLIFAEVSHCSKRFFNKIRNQSILNPQAITVGVCVCVCVCVCVFGLGVGACVRACLFTNDSQQYLDVHDSDSIASISTLQYYYV